MQFKFFFYKKSIRPFWTILFGKITVQTFVTLDTSTQYTNKSETILQTKPFIAFLNRSSGIKRGQPHNTYNIIITDTKQRQHLCFFVPLSELLGGYSYAFRRQPQKKKNFYPCSKPSRTKAHYTYNEAASITTTN